MLVKLIKYEFKDTSRIIPFFYLITLMFIGIVLFATESNIMWFRMTSSILLLFIGIAVSVITWVIIVIRFYKNLFSNEGYLMFTLPVKTYTLLTSKTIVSICWTMLSNIIGICAVLIGMYGLGIAEDLVLISEKLSEYRLDYIILCVIILVMLESLYLLCLIFFAITISNRSSFHKLGIAGAFIIYIVTNIILQIVGSLFSIFVPISLDLNIVNEISISLTFENMFGYLLDTFRGIEPTNVVIGLGGVIFELIMICVLFYITLENMKEKLSLK